MLDVLRNPEWKSVVVKVIALQVICVVTIFFFMSYQMGQINKALLNQNAALIGYVLKQEPRLENDIIHFITQGAQASEVDEGKRVLSQYAYTEDMPVQEQPILANHSSPLQSAAIVLLFTVMLLLLIYWEYRKVFSKIRIISHAAEQVVEQQFDRPLPEHDEGDFSALGRSFNAMADRLRHSLDMLQQEKIFLRNLLSDISHQLKTPLASLIVFNENLLKDDTMKPEMRVKFLERSQRQLERMEWLIISLLKLARVEAGAIVFRKESVRIREVIEHVLQSLRSISEQKAQKIDINDDVDLYVLLKMRWNIHHLKVAFILNLRKIRCSKRFPSEMKVRASLLKICRIFSNGSIEALERQSHRVLGLVYPYPSPSLKNRADSSSLIARQDKERNSESRLIKEIDEEAYDIVSFFFT